MDGPRRIVMPSFMKTSNPALGENTFQGFPLTDEAAMTFDGTLNKTAVLLLCAFVTAACAWSVYMGSRSLVSVLPLFWIGTVGALVFAIITIVKKEWSPYTAPLYSLLEGLAIGSISAFLEAAFPGTAIKAVSMTFGVLFVMLFVYSLHIIPIRKKLRMGIVSATGAVALFYLSGFALSFFGINFGILNGGSYLSIGLSFVVVILAALNFILDFDFIETGVRTGVPKYMEWYGAFGVMVTLVWLYLEVFRLLGKIRSRERSLQTR
jgi:uncharacterized YccA/Bax inhibitor family protein